MVQEQALTMQNASHDTRHWGLRLTICAQDIPVGAPSSIGLSSM